MAKKTLRRMRIELQNVVLYIAQRYASSTLKKSQGPLVSAENQRVTKRLVCREVLWGAQQH